MFITTWKGRSFDLGKMTMRDLIKAYFTFYAIQTYLGLAFVSLILTPYFFSRLGWSNCGGCSHYIAVPSGLVLITPLCITQPIPLPMEINRHNMETYSF